MYYGLFNYIKMLYFLVNNVILLHCAVFSGETEMVIGGD
jgi:hypothetical protein